MLQIGGQEDGGRAGTASPEPLFTSRRGLANAPGLGGVRTRLKGLAAKSPEAVGEEGKSQRTAADVARPEGVGRVGGSRRKRSALRSTFVPFLRGGEARGAMVCRGPLEA